MSATRCKCTLEDCAYYRPAPGERPPVIDCAHPDKPHYMHNMTCPLYKKEWASKQTEDKVAELRARMLAKRPKP